MSFDSLGLSVELLRAVSEQGYTEATPIQRRAIPVILRGLDVMAGAQTGTGKTAGFTLPLLQRLSTSRAGVAPRARGPRPLRALVLTPTRELAAQVAESMRTYGRHLPLKSAVIFGGVKINPQIDTLRRGVDVLVATPGRLLDHAGQRTVDLSKVEVLVLDEADRMLDMGFIHDIKKVLALLPPRAARQNLLFSATFSDDIKRLADQLLNSPELIEVAPRNTTAERIAQVVHPVDKHRKRQLLSHMVGLNDWRQVLVFTRTKHGANRLAQQLESDGLRAAAIHGNKSQGARTRALADFKSGDVRVLVATDIAARGLDIDQLPHVVNYELPNVPEDYVHRIGRTGRAGNAGEAVSLVCVDELKLLRDIERLLRREISKQVLPGYEPDPSIRAEPILNGRNNGRGNDRERGRGRSRPQPQSENRGRDRLSAGNRSDASSDSRYESGSSRAGSPGSGSLAGSKRAGSQQAGEGRKPSKPAHGHGRRTQVDGRGQPQHRHPRSGKRSPRAALVGGGYTDD